MESSSISSRRVFFPPSPPESFLMRRRWWQECIDIFPMEPGMPNEYILTVSLEAAKHRNSSIREKFPELSDTSVAEFSDYLDGVLFKKATEIQRKLQRLRRRSSTPLQQVSSQRISNSIYNCPFESLSYSSYLCISSSSSSNSSSSSSTSSSSRSNDTVHFYGTIHLVGSCLVGDKGLRRLLLVLTDHGVQIRLLRLHKNQFTDQSALYISQFICKMTTAIREIHLSHNYLTREGVMAIFAALCSPGKQSLYPFKKNNRYCPVWLRVEFNYIQAPQQLLKDVLRNQWNIRICDASEVECKPGGCCAVRKGGSKESCPLVHLVCFNKQRQKNSGGSSFITSSSDYYFSSSSSSSFSSSFSPPDHHRNLLSYSRRQEEKRYYCNAKNSRTGRRSSYYFSSKFSSRQQPPPSLYPPRNASSSRYDRSSSNNRESFASSSHRRSLRLPRSSSCAPPSSRSSSSSYLQRTGLSTLRSSSPIHSRTSSRSSTRSPFVPNSRCTSPSTPSSQENRSMPSRRSSCENSDFSSPSLRSQTHSKSSTISVPPLPHFLPPLPPSSSNSDSLVSSPSSFSSAISRSSPLLLDSLSSSIVSLHLPTSLRRSSKSPSSSSELSTRSSLSPTSSNRCIRSEKKENISETNSDDHFSPFFSLRGRERNCGFSKKTKKTVMMKEEELECHRCHIFPKRRARRILVPCRHLFCLQCVENDYIEDTSQEPLCQICHTPVTGTIQVQISDNKDRSSGGGGGGGNGGGGGGGNGGGGNGGGSNGGGGNGGGGGGLVKG